MKLAAFIEIAENANISKTQSSATAIVVKKSTLFSAAGCDERYAVIDFEECGPR